MGKASPSFLKNTPYSGELYECMNCPAMYSKPVVKMNLFLKAFCQLKKKVELCTYHLLFERFFYHHTSEIHVYLRNMITCKHPFKYFSVMLDIEIMVSSTSCCFHSTGAHSG